MSVVDEVKQRLDIVEVVGDYVQLTRAGRNFKAVCPFHTEKTPSFFVFPDRQTWHCFGACGAGGDVVSFVMRAENTDFAEALRRLADRAGVPLTSRRADTASASVEQRLYATNQAVANHYHGLLMAAPTAAAARRYLDGRGLTAPTLVAFGLGYCPPTGSGLLESLRQQGFSRDEMVAVGAIIDAEGESPERFRGRIVFPIHDDHGRCVGFGGRVLGDGLPKYVNSPQTPVFDKGGLLYGLHRARSAIGRAGAVVIVEGYMDVITAHQSGFENVVASMGTSLTERQLRLLRGLKATLMLALDADAAGQAATDRGLRLAAESLDQAALPYANWLGSATVLDAEVKVFALPSGKDPDALIREDAEAWRGLTATAKPAVEFWFDAAARRYDLGAVKGRSDAVAELLPVVRRLADPVQRETYLSRLARLVGVSERTLQDAAASLQAAVQPARRARSPSRVFDRRAPEAPLASERVVRDALEEHCLALLLSAFGGRPQSVGLTLDHFRQAENREVFLALETILPDGKDDWMAALPEAVREHVAYLLTEAEAARQRVIATAMAREHRRRPSVGRTGRSGLSERQREVAQGRAETGVEAALEKALRDCAKRLEVRRLQDLRRAQEALLAEIDGGGTQFDISPQAPAEDARLGELFGDGSPAAARDERR